MSDGSVTINFNGDTKDLEKDIKGIGSNFNQLKSIATKALGAIGFGSLIKSGVEYNATIEQLQTSFEVMTGSASKANEVVERLKEIGANTPFEFTGLAETTQLLMNYGFTADDAIDKMMMLGDISQGSADKMNRIATAYGQMSSAGKVSLEDIKQMIEAGFNPLQEISQSTGESMASLYDRISKGTISIDEITASMERSTSAGGKYFQSMEKQSETLNGQWSTLQDNFNNFIGTILKPINELLANEILPVINDVLGKLSEKIETTDWEKFGNTLKTILGFIVPLTAGFVAFKASLTISNLVSSATAALKALTLSQLKLNLAQLASPTTWIIAGITALVAAIIYLWNTNEGFRNAITTAWNAIKETVSNIVDGIVTFFTETIPNAWNSFITGLQELGQTIWDTLVNVWNSIVSFFTEGIPNFIASVIQWFQELPYKIGYFIGQIIARIVQFGIDAWNWVTVELPKIIQGIIDWFAKLPGNIWNWLVDTVNKIVKWGQNVLNTASQWVSNTINAIVEWFSQLPGRIWEWLVNTVNNIINWGKDMVNRGIEAARNLVTNIVDTIKSLPGKVLDIGKNLVEGLWNGISSAAGWLWSKVTGFCSGIVDGIKDFFGIHSPSILFNKEIGQMLGLGLGEGFDDSLSSVYKDMQKAIEHENAKLTSNLTNTHQIQVQNEDNRQATLKSIDDNKEIVVNTTTKLDNKVIARETNKVNSRQKLQYGLA